MKGSLEGVLPMIGILLMAIVLSMQSIPLSEVMNDAVSDSTSDIETVINTRAYADFYFYNYVPLAAEYAWNEVSYELGQEGGGETWTSSWLDDHETNMRTLQENVNDYSGGNLSDTVTGSEGVCDIPDSDYQISGFLLKTTEDFKELEDEEARLYVSHDTSTGNPFSFNPEPIETTCNFGGESYYQDESLFYSTETNATDNRYIQLADESLNFFLELKTELDTISDQSNTEKKCGDYPSASSVEDDAAEDLEDEVENTIDDVKADYPTRNGFSIEKLGTDIDVTYDYGYDSDIVDADSTKNDWTGSCCSQCGPSYPDIDWHHRKVTVSPNVTEIDWVLEDTEYKVIVEENYENLQFRVEPYEHNFQ